MICLVYVATDELQRDFLLIHIITWKSGVKETCKYGGWGISYRESVKPGLQQVLQFLPGPTKGLESAETGSSDSTTMFSKVPEVLEHGHVQTLQVQNIIY